MDDAKIFIAEWLDDNIRPEGYVAEGDDTRAHELADFCRSDALKEGISDHGLEAAARDMIGSSGDLVTLVAQALEDANNEEVSRLKEKDA